MELVNSDCSLIDALKKSGTVEEKLQVLQGISLPIEVAFPLSAEGELILKQLAAIGQLESLLKGVSSDEVSSRVEALIAAMLPVEDFYREMGGIVGYQAMLRHFLMEKRSPLADREYYQPVGIDLMQETPAISEAVAAGIFTLPLMAEMYPVGGAADRLRLCDPDTFQPLPAAKLNFCGHTLLEGLIRDLQAREYVYYQLTKEQLITPVALMTSQEKDNHAQIVGLCEELRWFGRPSSRFMFFSQPLVPTMDKEGNWCLLGPCRPLMKPGGHGVIWKVAKDQGVLGWLQQLGRRKLLVRQINNVIAGCDYGLLAFTGIGCRDDKAFGFASCLRQVGSAEGVNVMTGAPSERGMGYSLTNIEYCDFQKFGIEDIPAVEGGVYSQFPSNTNILFADIEKVLEKIALCPIPGMLVNLKKITFHDESGALREEEVARLESTMQNIADSFVEYYPSFPSDLKTFLTFNHRRKTISTAKKEFQPGASLLETPEGCYVDLIHNAHELLTRHCGFSLPALVDFTESPWSAFHFHYHPALGPLYEIIGQKLRGGSLASGAEVVLEIAELDVENLHVDGSLLIQAKQVMGHGGEELTYSARVGRCRLKNVSVRNLGIDRSLSGRYWKGAILRREACEIILLGESEFIAENVVFEGGVRIVVEPGMRMQAYSEEGKLYFKKEALKDSKPYWNYELNEEKKIVLSREKAK